MRAVILTRVSTDEQRESGAGLKAQLDACTAYARRNNLEIVGPFTEEGVSGAAPLEKRHGLMAALDALKAGDILLVSKRDRLARDLNMIGAVEVAIGKRKCRLVSAAGEGTEGVEPDNALMRMIIDSFAVYERLVIRARTKSALGAKKRRGERTGSVPLGHDLADDGRKSKAGLPLALVVNPAEQATLATIRGLAAGGSGARAIARELTRRGIPTKTGKSKWTHGAVQKILARAAEAAA